MYPIDRDTFANGNQQIVHTTLNTLCTTAIPVADALYLLVSIPQASNISVIKFGKH